MKNEKTMKLHPAAFALAGGILGLIMGFFMGGSYGMMGSYYGMMGQTTGGVGMGIAMGILSGAFALLYNWLCERMEK